MVTGAPVCNTHVEPSARATRVMVTVICVADVMLPPATAPRVTVSCPFDWDGGPSRTTEGLLQVYVALRPWNAIGAGLGPAGFHTVPSGYVMLVPVVWALAEPVNGTANMTRTRTVRQRTLP